MIIKYTKESFDHKPNWETECKNLRWKQHQGGFFDYIYLWQTGHIMDIGDNELMDFIIVDIDNLPAGKRNWLNKSCSDIANALDVKSCHVFDSSSRKSGKCKVYLELFEPIAISDMELFLTEFEIFCDIEVDKCTKSAYQLNYGIMLNSPDYIVEPAKFYNDIPAVRSTKSTKKDIFIPVNQQEKNRLLGKKPYNDPRLEWNYYKFTYINNKWNRETILIQEGNRQKTLSMLVKIVTFNACMLNKYYNKTYTHNEIYHKVCSIIGLQFCQYKQFLIENRNHIFTMCYNEWHSQMSLDVLVNYKNLCTTLNKKENYSYMPREFTASAIYKAIKDSLSGLSLEEIQDKIGYIAEGDEAVIRRIWYYYNRDQYKGIRQDKGKTHAYPKRKETNNYENLIKTFSQIDEYYLIPKEVLTANLKRYMSNHKLKYHSIK